MAEKNKDNMEIDNIYKRQRTDDFIDKYRKLSTNEKCRIWNDATYYFNDVIMETLNESEMEDLHISLDGSRTKYDDPKAAFYGISTILNLRFGCSEHGENNAFKCERFESKALIEILKKYKSISKYIDRLQNIIDGNDQYRTPNMAISLNNIYVSLYKYFDSVLAVDYITNLCVKVTSFDIEKCKSRTANHSVELLRSNGYIRVEKEQIY